jgi:hypothetical protein
MSACDHQILEREGIHGVYMECSCGWKACLMDWPMAWQARDKHLAPESYPYILTYASGKISLVCECHWTTRHRATWEAAGRDLDVHLTAHKCKEVIPVRHQIYGTIRLSCSCGWELDRMSVDAGLSERDEHLASHSSNDGVLEVVG